MQHEVDCECAAFRGLKENHPALTKLLNVAFVVAEFIE